MVTMTMFVKNTLPLKYGLERGYARVHERNILIKVPTAVTITVFFSPLNTSPVRRMYWYALRENSLGIRKNARSVSSRSVAKEPAIM